MKNKSISFFLGFSALVMLTACATTQENSSEQVSYLSEYPTRDRVEYVLTCIAQHGGLNYINQYACGCKIDKIAEKLTFSDYDAGKTFTNLRGVAGESGAAFRDPQQSKDLRKKIKEAEAFAEKNCFVK